MHQDDSNTSRTARVLVADDDEEIRDMVATALRNEGYDVVEAKNGRELLAQIGYYGYGASVPAPDLIVSDIRMPGVTGIDVLRRLRSASWPTPIVFMTAYGTPELRSEMEQLGARGFFQKPFDLDQFRSRVSGILNGEARLPS